jgi:plasmid stability protein
MATLNVKGLSDALYKKLQARAKRDRRSVAQEVAFLLTEALETPKPPTVPGLRGLGKENSPEETAVSLDDETYRRAREIAAERGTSISALVKDVLSDASSGEGASERYKREEFALRERIANFRASARLSRDEIHARGM